MIYDSLTYAGAAISVFVLILVFGSIFYSHSTMKRNIRISARNSILMHADDEIRDLCKKIIAIDPNSCPLMDGSACNLIKAEPEKLKNILKSHLAALESKNEIKI